MKRLPILTLIFIFISLSEPRAQYKNYNTEKEIWSEGEIIDRSGRKIKGLVNYNFVVDQVRVQLPSGEIITKIPSNTRSFTIVDSTGTQTYRSLPCDILENGRSRLIPTFFQELYRNENYAVLSRHHLGFMNPAVLRSSLSARNASVSANPDHTIPNRANVKELVIETIYFANKQGTIIPIIHGKKSANWTPHLSQKIRYHEKKLKQSNRNKEVKKFKFVDYEYNFRTFFGEDFKAYKIYTETNNLDLRSIDGLIKSLNFNLN